MSVKDKQLVAIGKILWETPGVPWNFPHTHFIVKQTSSGLFEATNIMLVLDSVGASIDEAVRLLARLTADYAKEIMTKGRGHDELIEIVSGNAMEEYWQEYRIAEVELSKTGRDMGHKIDRHIIEAVKETWGDDLRDIIYKAAEDHAEKVISALKDKFTTPQIVVSVEYRELKAA